MAEGTGTYVKADIVVEEASASIDHFDIVELSLAHCLKDWNLHRNAPEIELSSFIWIHAVELCRKSAPPARSVMSVTILTSGEEILTFLAFSVRIFSSSTYDSRKRVYVQVSKSPRPVHGQ